MSKYNFLYRDSVISKQRLGEYEAGHVFLEPSGLEASFFRGGLLTGCNNRVLITLEIGSVLSWAETDFTNRGIFVFSSSRYFRVLDVYRVGEYSQILMTPNVLEDDIKAEVIDAAQKDFYQTFNKPPVQVLDTPAWRAKVKYILGSNRKTLKHHFDT